MSIRDRITQTTTQRFCSHANCKVELKTTYIYPADRAGGELLAMRESQSNCGYLGQNDPLLHFGLGRRSYVDVVVLFLDGTKALRHRVPVNQTILIEGKSYKLRQGKKSTVSVTK